MKKKKNILVIRLSSIGDIVLTTPLIRILYEMGYEVDFLVKPQFAEVLTGNPYIRKLHYYSPDVHQTLREKDFKYDHIIDLQNNLRSRKLTLSLGISTTRFHKINLRKWVLTSFKINILPKSHIVDRYLYTGRKLGIQNDDKGLDFFLFDKDIPEDKIRGMDDFVAMAIGAAHDTKAIPVELGSQILAHIDRPVAIIGAVKDWERAHQMIEQSGHPDVRNLCGKLSIRGSAGVIKKSVAVLAPDTGMMHIAAALKKPLAVIWGNTVPAFGMGPYTPEGSPSCNFEVPGLSCRPCSKLGYKQCPNGRFLCMHGHDPKAIAKRISQLCKTQ